MLDIFSLEHTYTLINAVERVDAPFSFLEEQFFPEKLTVETDFAAIEYRRGLRKLAPYVVTGSHGLNVARETANAQYYRVPLMAARRVIGLADLKNRQFGELPQLYGAPTPAERFAKMQAADLVDLLRLHANRRGQMASEILQTGKLQIAQYSDDGKISVNDEIEFAPNVQYTPSITWDKPAAKIYSDLKNISESIQEKSGLVPTLAICGRNVESYLLSNTEMKNWLLVPNRENLMMANFAPTFKSPEVRYIGRISALNMEFISYAQTYISDDGAVKPFVEPDNVIIGVAKLGKVISAPVDFMQNGQWHRVSAATVPVYSYSDDAQTTALSVYSRCILVPDVFAGWCCVKTLG